MCDDDDDDWDDFHKCLQCHFPGDHAHHLLGKGEVGGGGNVIQYTVNGLSYSAKGSAQMIYTHSLYRWARVYGQ